MVTANQKPTIDTKTKKNKESKYMLKLVIKLQEKRTKEEGKKKNLEKQIRIINKMAIRTYISIFTLKRVFHANGNFLKSWSTNTNIKQNRL